MEHYTTIGIDVTDRTSKGCVMAKVGGQRRIVEETTVATTKEAFRAYLERKDRSWPVTFETGAHCRWMERTIGKMGFKVYVANPACMRALLKDPARKYVPLSERGRLELERLQRENETIEAMRMAS